jgi:uridine phosphorylase
MIQSSELILNPDGSVYHLNLKPEHIAHIILWAIKIVWKKHNFLTALNFPLKENSKPKRTIKGKRIVSCQQE